MKRFLTISVILGIFLFGYRFFSLRYGLYIDVLPDKNVEINFYAEDQKILYKDSKNEKEFIIKGVEVTGSIPEYNASDYAADEEDYLRWMDYIHEMGANTLKVSRIMDDDFYNAFYAYNDSNESPLYLIHSIIVSDEKNYSAGDAFDKEYLDAFLECGYKVVDIIHGKRDVITNETGGTGKYRKDISEWVIGYVVGAEWDADKMIYTNKYADVLDSYKGKYFMTTDKACLFEVFLAQVMDKITAYEGKKYHEQHMIGFVNAPHYDPFKYEDVYSEILDDYRELNADDHNYARQLDKLVEIDAENIVTSTEMHAGYFAAYKLYDFCDEFYKYLSKEQLECLDDVLAGLDKERSYDGYLELLGRYHTIPVIASEFGISSSRGGTRIKDGEIARYTEKEQGEELARIYTDILNANWCGGIINSWQDQWERRTWNTVFAQDARNNNDWKDVQTEGQGFGLMEFTSEICEIDGDLSEWNDDDLILTDEEKLLSIKVDSEGLCLLLQGDDINREKTWYLPIDTVNSSGSKWVDGYSMELSREADFLLIISGEENTEILVQEYYDSVRQNFLYEIDGRNPFVDYPKRNSDVFVPIYTVGENNYIFDSISEEKKTKKHLLTCVTGKLRHGNNNPNLLNYDSLADFCFGNDCVEIRIPWLLLNFSNPSKLMIHGDYYAEYGVSFQKLKEFWIGLSDGTDEFVELQKCSLKWKDTEYVERLKESYKVIQSMWMGLN